MIVPGSASPLLSTTEATGYTIAKSLRFRSSASAYLNRTPSSAGNRKIWTWSAWVKLGTLSDGTYNRILFSSSNGSVTDTTWNNLNINSSGSLMFGGGNTVFRATSAVYRDLSAWYHIVLAFDSTQATGANRVKMYVNGTQITSFSSSADPTQNTDYAINQAAAHYINGNLTTYYTYNDCYMTEVNFVDGQQLSASSFGETDSVTGVWKLKAYTGTYGTNGFYLKFTDVATTSGSNAGLGKDFSGNGNYWTTNNISVTSGATYDSMKDVPTLTDTDTANYCTLNPLYAALPNATITNGNLQINSSVSSDNRIHGTIAVTSGKWYYETAMTGFSGTPYYYVGWAKVQNPTSSNYNNLYWTSYEWGSNGVRSTTVNNSSSSVSATTFTTGDVLGIAFDADAGTITCYKNGTSLGVYFSGITVDAPFRPDVYTNSASAYINFGQQPFAYTPPTGYKALNTYNLPDSTIVAGNKVMDATTWTANGTIQTVTNNGGFKPDFIWAKNRSIGQNHYSVDTNQGLNWVLKENSTAAASSDANFFTSANSNGFSLGSSNFGNGENIVAWQWQAGQGTNTSNTGGSITSTVSVNASAGFSIVTYTGTGANATVGHGLGIAPQFVVVKRRNSTGDWCVWNLQAAATYGSDRVLFLNSTDSATSVPTVFNSSSPTSSVINLGTNAAVNGSGGTYIAYCWSEIAGFSKFGSYTGNGSTDGTFVYTGFRPKFVLIKRTDTTDDWVILDTSRSSYNVMGNELYPDLSSAEGTGYSSFDYLSNGFKNRSTGTRFNASGGTYIYAAFAENPFKNALAR